MTAVATRAAPVWHAATRPLNVLHTVRSLRVNGITNVVLRTIGALDPVRVQSHVCSVYDDDHLAFVLRERGIEPVFARHGGAGSVARTVSRIARLIRERDIDVVHANQVIDGVLAGAAARLCGVPLVLSIHWTAEPDTTVRDGTAARMRARAHQAMQHGVRVVSDRLLADRIVAVSEAVADTHSALLGRGFPRAKVEVIPPGLDFDDVPTPSAEERARLRGELGLEPGARVILNIGRLDPVKGQVHLIPMMQRVVERVPDAMLLIAGDGQLRESLESGIASSGVAANIRMLGWRLDVDALLAIADVLVISSETEAAPLPVLEAARRRTPVVATRVGGIPEVIEDGVTGYTAPRADPDALAAAVLRVLADPDAARVMGEAAHDRLAASFGIGESARRLAGLYESLVPARSIS